ncbi:MAG: DUF1573 domain-containing protein [Breznakibacter sp.]|nr:DUF1573 domain-containing protein [Breznakibacter sp.]
MRKLFLFFGIGMALFSFGSCGEQKRKPESENKGSAKMVFETKFNTFGDVKQDEVVGISYRFNNKGNAPLIINEVQKGCGCTEVVYPKNAIASNDSAVVEVIFDSAGFSGKQFKTVLIYCNDPESPIQLSFSANVISEY